MVSDLNGSQVELLNNKILHKGSHQLSWKADDHASGIYFITIKQGGLIETKKITLLK
jgi:hypothetical protein